MPHAFAIARQLLRLSPPTVFLKREWSDPWQATVVLEPLKATAASSGSSLGRCTLRTRYGELSWPHSSVLGSFQAVDLRGWWVQLRFIGELATTPVWTGRISVENRDLFSSTSTAGGIQIYTAYEPLRELQKLHVHRSLWHNDADPTAPKGLGWVENMNPVDGRNAQIGNRSAVLYDPDPGGPDGQESYLYGTGEAWTRTQALRYIIRRFVDPFGSSGPNWLIGGQFAALDGFVDTLSFKNTQTVADIMRQIISPRIGLDYTIRYQPETDDAPGTDAFVIHIYALSANPQSFGGQTLPGNPDSVTITASQAPELLKVKLERSGDQHVSKIRCIGGRIVVCCSLGGALVPDNINSALVPKWSPALETIYNAGTGVGGDLPEEHDSARLRPLLSEVYQKFGAPTDWDHLGGGPAAPLMYLDGTVETSLFGPFADYQNSRRRTLGWIPLVSQIDYLAVPPVDFNVANTSGDFLQPMLFLFGPPPVQEGDQTPDHRWFLADEAGVSVSVATKDWGVILGAKPQHLLALNHFVGAAPTGSEPLYDYDKMVATIAFESDQRLELGEDMPAGPDDVDIGGEMVIELPQAELWYMPVGTVVGVNSDGTLRQTQQNLVLRNDTPRVALAVAGAIARYLAERNRATITVKGFFPFSNMIGTIVSVAQSGDDSVEIDAPITEIRFDFKDAATTTIRTGFAK